MDGRSPLPPPKFSTRIRNTGAAPYLAIIAVDGPSGWAWGTMQGTGKPISAPTRKLLLNLLLEERAGTFACRPPCSRCLCTLRSHAGISQKISRLSTARTRRNPISICGFWHEETRRRCPAVLQTRPFATVREGTVFRLPELDRTNKPRSTLNV
jgi:hypothetical protein